ncbi:MAG: glycosyltransferase family 4 protein, partial [Bacillota bacterium]|nr:glycosyltransferase family 4 protein [Bacillota bacterium]
MKVLMCIRSDYYRNFGGDTVQLLKLTENLRKLGVEIEINDGFITDYSTYDIVHLFNIAPMGETYKYYKIARHFKKNIVLTPMYWDFSLYYNYINDQENLRLWERCNIYRKEIIKGCRVIYPNSNIEAELIKSQLGVNIASVIVYNGVDIMNEDIPLYSLKERYNLDNYVLTVGKVCHRKNQLVLARVCRELNIELVLIGDIKDKAYYEKCMEIEGTRYLGFLDSYNIYNAYRFARLHVLPSFVENPGLSSLEAAASGCSIVSTNQGSAAEYFGDKAIYCDPYDEGSIYDAVKQGIKA